MTAQSPAAGLSGGDALHELSRSVLDLVIDHPFFGHLAGGLTRRLVPDQLVPLALHIEGGRFTLGLSPTLFIALSRKQRLVAIEHALLHAVLAHPVRAADHPDAAALFVAACDIVVNQLLTTGRPLRGWFTLADLPPQDRVPDLTVEEYLTILKRLHAANCLSPRAKGCCGGAASRWCPAPGAPDGEEVSGSGSARGDATVAATRLAWAAFEHVIDAAARRLTTKSWGRMPASLRTYLRTMLDARDGTLDWRRVLRMFAASSRPTRMRSTLRRPSRRYHTFPGIRVARGQRMAVCVDTSGSITDATLQDFFAEVHLIWRAGAEVTVIEVDAAVQRTWSYTGSPPASVTGRGGTSFDPGLAAVRDAVPRFDACVYLTDGYAPAPTTHPRLPLLWLVTPDGRLDDQLPFGVQVLMR